MKHILSIFLLIVMTCSFCSCTNKETVELKEEEIRAVCELGTIKCFYNNVAEINKKADNIFQKDRKMWIEYEAEATLGVDMTKLKIDISGEKVTVTMPKVEILSIGIKEETFNKKSYVASEDGLFFKNKITTEEQSEAMTIGQKDTKEAVSKNASLFKKAEARAKELIENYIKKIGEINGVEYEIVYKQG